ncbi:MAG: ATP-dependent RNA helicase RhlE [Polaribacter sp.]|jgi:ATP-dependent RNA helicase RhlE
MPFQRLPKSIQKILHAQGFNEPYPIQSEAIPLVLEGRDVLAIAKTGSGKTASYVLPVLTNLIGKTALKNRQVKVLVLVPTRELAIQVSDVFVLFAEKLPEPVKTLSVYGGVSINPQMKAMRGVHILVATPGRLLDLVDSNALQLGSVDTVVLDEADKMLNLGFKDEMRRIFEKLPAKRQNLLFSATLSPDLSGITDVLLQDPAVIKIEEKEEEEVLINQRAFLVEDDRKGPLLRTLIKENDWQQVLVFTSSVYKADQVANKLRKNDIDAESIHSKKSQGARKQNLARFKSGGLRVLVATDLLSRGIDIEVLPYVINYELPRSPKDYIHRIGRTGRAGASGEAISFVTEADRHHFKVIQKKMGTWVEYEREEI